MIFYLFLHTLSVKKSILKTQYLITFFGNTVNALKSETKLLLLFCFASWLCIICDKDKFTENHRF